MLVRLGKLIDLACRLNLSVTKQKCLVIRRGRKNLEKVADVGTGAYVGVEMLAASLELWQTLGNETKTTK